MFASDDTIAAIATPPGRGGLGVIRISGPAAASVASRLLGRRSPLAPRRATFARVVQASGETESTRQPRGVDHVVATFFPGPHSYTGDDVVELSAHGSPVLLREILQAAMNAGARLAEPGGFTLRAYLNGRMDLVQAEAVADLIEAVTPVQARTAFDQLEGTLTGRIREIDDALLDLTAQLEASLDFPEEGYHFVAGGQAVEQIAGIASRVEALLADAARGRLIREGATVVIVGKPNVGKSTLFNRLLGADRAIVTDVPGTTRDLLAERADVGGIPMTLVDGAGVRETVDRVEAEGVTRARRAVEQSDLVLVLLDATSGLDAWDEALLRWTAERRRLVVLNKTDRIRPPETSTPSKVYDLKISALEGFGLEGLREAMIERLTGSERWRDDVAVTNVRHQRLLERAQESLLAAAERARAGASEEFVLADLTAARHTLEELTGSRSSDDVLRHIFGRFCIGK